MHPAIPTKAADTADLADSLTSGTPIAWRGHVCLLIASGILATAPIGKAIISIPVIRDDLMLSPAFASLIIVTFATLGTVFGLGAGIAIHRLDDRWSPILGMAAISIGSLIGAVAPNEVILLAARVFEGAGFLGVVLAIPSTLARIVPCADRQLVMTVWPAYMPVGFVVMMLLGPLLRTIGWQTLWLATALLTGACSLALAIFAPRLPKAVAAEATDHFGITSAVREVALTCTKQGWKAERSEVCVGMLDARFCLLRLYVPDVLARVYPAVAADIDEECGAWNRRYG